MARQDCSSCEQAEDCILLKPARQPLAGVDLYWDYSVVKIDVRLDAVLTNSSNLQ